MSLKSIINRNRGDIALLIGNGINRFNDGVNRNSWEDLLMELWDRYTHIRKSTLPEGITLTEFYDILDLRRSPSFDDGNLQKEFCDLIDSWVPKDQHENITGWASDNEVPILTTNFENTLGQAADCTLYRITKGGFTYFYPWESYYSNTVLETPLSGFGIWHINGMSHYPRSIRLGLTHYMGSVQRARSWLHKGDEQRLFSGKNMDNWAGRSSWLHILFNKDLVIFGIGLGSDEIFLRWLLIERYRYFSKFPDRRKNAWYVQLDRETSSGKNLLFENIGIETVTVPDYGSIYHEPWQ